MQYVGLVPSWIIRAWSSTNTFYIYNSYKNKVHESKGGKVLYPRDKGQENMGTDLGQP